MDSSRRNAPSILAALRVSSRSRRKSAKPARMACETLEGRQLLTGGASLPGAVSGPGTASPVEIHPVMARTDAINVGTTDPVTLNNDIALPDGQPLPELTASTTMLPLAASTAEISTAPGDTGQAIPFGLGADPAAMSGAAGHFESHGDFFATRGGVAMNDAPASVALYRAPVPFSVTGAPASVAVSGAPVPVALAGAPVTVGRMMTPPTDAAQGDGELAKALQKLKDDQATVDARSEVTPAMLAAVKADLEAIDAARTTDADEAALATLRADTEALQAAEVPTDDLLARVQADTAAVYVSEGVSQTLIDQWQADQAKVKAASNVTPEDLQLLADDRAAIQALRDAAIQTFRGAPAAEATTGGDGSSIATASTLVAASPLMAQATSADPAASDQAVPPTTLADDGQMATTTVAPTDVKVIMAPASSDSTIKFKGEGQKIKAVKGMIGKARMVKATRMRFLHAGRRGVMRAN